MPKPNSSPDLPTRLLGYKTVEAKLTTASDTELLTLFGGVSEAEATAITGVILSPRLDPSLGASPQVEQITGGIQRVSQRDFSILTTRLAKLAPSGSDREARQRRVFRFNLAVSGYLFASLMADLLRPEEVSALKAPVTRLLGWR
jgi:hypothetical protein